MKIKILVLLFSLTSLSVFSQNRFKQMERKIEAKKIAYISDNLDLTPEEAQVFWPLYNGLTSELEELQSIEESEENIDATADEKLDALMAMESKKLDIKKTYASKFRKVIGAQKTLTFFTLDKGFKKKMLKGYQKRQKGLLKDKQKKGSMFGG